MAASKNNPASICWSWRRLQDMPWRRLHHVFSVKTLRLPRLLENVLKTSWRCLKDILHNVFKTSCKTSLEPINCYAEDVLKISWRHVLKTSWRCLEDISWRRLEDTMERNKILTGDLTNLYFTNLYLAILRRIQNALIKTQ